MFSPRITSHNYCLFCLGWEIAALLLVAGQVWHLHQRGCKLMKHLDVKIVHLQLDPKLGGIDCQLIDSSHSSAMTGRSGTRASSRRSMALRWGDSGSWKQIGQNPQGVIWRAEFSLLTRVLGCFRIDVDIDTTAFPVIATVVDCWEKLMSHKFLSLVWLMHHICTVSTRKNSFRSQRCLGSLCIHTHRLSGSSGAKAELTETTKRTPAVQDVDMESGCLGSWVTEFDPRYMHFWGLCLCSTCNLRYIFTCSCSFRQCCIPLIWWAQKPT